MRINSKGYSGSIKKNANVYTNDPENSMVTLAIEAFIKVPILISPRYVSFTTYEGRVVSRSITITANEDEPLKLEPADFNLSAIMTYDVKVVEPGKVFKITFVNKPMPEGTVSGMLQLKTNYPEKPDISIPIRARFRKKIVRKAQPAAEKRDSSENKPISNE